MAAAVLPTGTAAALLAGGLMGPPAASASGPRWVIENVQLAELTSAQRQDLGGASNIVLAGNSEHYTSIAPCPAGLGDTPPCLSLTTSPPPAGTWAVYDNERHWGLTPAAEYTAPCTAAAQAAQMIRAAGAYPAISIPMTTAYRVRCAARAAGSGGILIAGGQGSESSTSSYMNRLRWVTSNARATVSGLHVNFGLSTNPAYSPTAYRMWVDYTHATSYLGWRGSCWLNIIPWPGQPGNWAAVKMARAFLDRVYG